jgi:hypothetical protein
MRQQTGLELVLGLLITYISTLKEITYSAIANSHNLQFTIAPAESSRPAVSPQLGKQMSH